MTKTMLKMSSASFEWRTLIGDNATEWLQYDDVIQLGQLRSQSFIVRYRIEFQFIQISVFSKTSSPAVFPTRWNQLDSNLANLEATVDSGV